MPRKRHSTKFLTHDAAVGLLHRHDACLVQVTGGEWFVLPSSGRLTPMVAEQITRREDMIGLPDEMLRATMPGRVRSCARHVSRT